MIIERVDVFLFRKPGVGQEKRKNEILENY